MIEQKEAFWFTRASPAAAPSSYEAMGSPEGKEKNAFDKKQLSMKCLTFNGAHHGQQEAA